MASSFVGHGKQKEPTAPDQPMMESCTGRVLPTDEATAVKRNRRLEKRLGSNFWRNRTAWRPPHKRHGLPRPAGGWGGREFPLLFQPLQRPSQPRLRCHAHATRLDAGGPGTPRGHHQQLVQSHCSQVHGERPIAEGLDQGPDGAGQHQELLLQVARRHPGAEGPGHHPAAEEDATDKYPTPPATAAPSPSRTPRSSSNQDLLISTPQHQPCDVAPLPPPPPPPAAWRTFIRGKGREGQCKWRSANWRRQLRTERPTMASCQTPLCDIPSGCCSFTGPWTVTRSSLCMLCRVATFCRPLRPVLLLVLFPRSRSPVVGVLGLC